MKLHLNVGYADGFREGQIAQVVAELAEVPERDVTRVAPHRRYAFFFVPTEVADRVLERIRDHEWQGKVLTAEPARERR